MTFLNAVLVELAILSLGAFAVRLLLAYLGREFIGLSGILGIFAYAFALAASQSGLVTGLALVVVGLALCIALVVAADAVSDDQGFALVTLLITLSFAGIVRNFEAAGGTFGLQIANSWQPSGNLVSALGILILAAAAMYMLERGLRRSQLGRAALVVKAYEGRSSFLSLPPLYIRGAIITTAMAVIGLAGLLYVLEYSFVAPESFPAMPAILALIIGSVAQKRSFLLFLAVTAAVFSADLLVRHLQFAPANVGNWRMIIFGSAIVVIAMYRPRRS